MIPVLFAVGQPRSEFALSLMREHDYFRAISVYKELAFSSTNDDSTIFYLSQIGKAYRLGEKYELSIDAYSRLLDAHKLSQDWNNEVQINLGLNYLGMDLPALAAPYFLSVLDSDTSGRALFYTGLVSCETEKWDDADRIFTRLSQERPSTRVGVVSSNARGKLGLRDALPSRSPTSAALFSAFLPGSGQIYSGHYVDGMQAFAYVSAFAFASYAMYRYDNKFNSNYILTGISISITALFHISNIIGAEHTAEYFNQRQRDLFLDDIRKESLQLERE